MPFPLPYSQQNNKNLLTVRQAAEILEVSQVTLRTWIRYGTIEYYQSSPGRPIRLDKRAVAKMLARREKQWIKPKSK